jgi:arylsulfatase A-like enzyme
MPSLLLLAACASDPELVSRPRAVPSVRIEPASPTVLDTLSVVTAGPDEQDPEFTWVADGLPVGAGPTLSGAVLRRGQRVQVQLQTAARSFPVVGEALVADAPPTATAARLDPPGFHRGTGVRCIGEGFADPDGDAAGWRFAWTVDDVPVAGTADALDPALWGRGSRVGCTATPDDGALVGEPVAVEGVAGDAPGVAIASFVGSPIWGLDPVVCAPAPEAGDPDGDPVAWSFAWTADGAPATADAETTYPGDTISELAAASARTWACTLTATSASGQSIDTAEIRPAAAGGNILVIVMDDWGVDKMGAYAEHPAPAPTPNMDALAAGGILFRHAWATPQCSSSRAAWMTGRHPRRHGVGEVIEYWESDFHLPYTELLIPAVLAGGVDLAYDTSFVGKWHLGTSLDDVGADHPNLAGWAWFAGSFGNLGNPWLGPLDGGSHNYTHWERIENGAFAPTDTYATTVTADDTIGRIAAMTPPWLLVASLNAAHTPYHVPPADLTTLAVDDLSEDPDLYDAIVEAADTEIGRILAATPADTTVILFGDNGTQTAVIREPWDPSQAKGTVTEGGLRVPFVASGLLVRAPGTECEGLVSIVDIFATIAQIAGIEVSALTNSTGAPLAQDGISLLPYFTDPERPSLRAVNYGERMFPNGPPPYSSDLRAVTDGRWKVIRVVNAPDFRDSLYDLSATGREEDDLLLAPLTPEAQVAYDQLSAALADYDASLVYDVPADP